jgi:hypothetical protein
VVNGFSAGTGKGVQVVYRDQKVGKCCLTGRTQKPTTFKILEWLFETGNRIV